jgi:hypothetical protein
MQSPHTQMPSMAPWFTARIAQLLPRFDAAEVEYAQDTVGGLIFVVGGYADDYASVTDRIQILHLASSSWLPHAPRLPFDAGTTHAAVGIDSARRLLYIASGQREAGCAPPVNTVYAWRWPAACAAEAMLRTVPAAAAEGGHAGPCDGEFIRLPPLPKGRYGAGVAVLLDSIHVMGGNDRTRNRPATDHWRLRLGPDGVSPLGEWETMPSAPASGCHSLAISLPENHSLVYLAQCTSDIASAHTGGSMDQCNRRAAAAGQRHHHDLRSPATSRFDTRTGVWTALPPMPCPACQLSHLHLARGRFVLVLGGAGNDPKVPTQPGAPARRPAPIHGQHHRLHPRARPVHSAMAAGSEAPQQQHPARNQLAGRR